MNRLIKMVLALMIIVVCIDPVKADEENFAKTWNTIAENSNYTITEVEETTNKYTKYYVDDDELAYVEVADSGVHVVYDVENGVVIDLATNTVIVKVTDYTELLSNIENNNYDYPQRGYYYYSAGSTTVTIADRWQYLGTTTYRTLQFSGEYAAVRVALAAGVSGALYDKFHVTNSSSVNRVVTAFMAEIVVTSITGYNSNGQPIYGGYEYIKNRNYGNVNQSSDFSYIMIGCNSNGTALEVVNHSPRLTMTMG